MEELISVIIPVHNGAKYLKRISKCVLHQSYKNIELIFVENFSKDNSLSILKSIEKRDSRVKLLESKERGTSLARKKGVEHANGKYTVFMDQDDVYIDTYSLENMHRIIVESGAEICQFSYYKKYSFGVRRKVDYSNQRIMVTIEDIRKKEVASMLEGTGILGCQVWNKIFLTQVLKDAVNLIDIPLFFAEDQFLNICSLTSKSLSKICIDTSAYYVWSVGTGFSAKKDSGDALIADYKKTKPRIINILESFNCDESVMYRLHLESLYFLANYLIEKTDCKVTDSNCALIDQMNHLEYIMAAKSYFNCRAPKEKLYEELIFLSSNYTPQEFCERFKYRTTKKYKIQRLTNRITKLIK